MSQPSMDRRSIVNAAGLFAASAPLAAFADGANSRTTVQRARSIYGSRVAKLLTGTPADIVAEENAFTLFISGTYRTIDQKATKKELQALQKKIVTAAKAGSVDKDSLQQFIKIAEVKDYVANPDSIFNPKQRRNAGAPATAEVVAQMGTQAYALYEPLKPGAPPATNK